MVVEDRKLYDLILKRRFDKALENLPNNTKNERERSKRLVQFKSKKESPLLLAIRLDSSQIELFKRIIDVGGDQVLEEKGRYGSNAWIYACWHNCPLDFIMYLKDHIKNQAKSKSLLEGNTLGHNAFHQVCRNSTSTVVVSFMANLFQKIAEDTQEEGVENSKAGSEDAYAETLDPRRQILLGKDNYGDNALFNCFTNRSSKILECVMAIYESNGILRDAILEKNKNNMNSLAFLCQRAPKEGFTQHFDLVYDCFMKVQGSRHVEWTADKEGCNYIDHLLQRNHAIPAELLRKIFNKDVFNKDTRLSRQYLQQIQGAHKQTRRCLLQNDFIKEFINEDFAKGYATSILLASFLFQLFLCFTFSFAKPEKHAKIYAGFITSGCLGSLVVEVVQLSNSPFNYFLHVPNYIDILQIVLMTMVCYDLFKDGSLGNKEDRFILNRLACTALLVGWKLLGVCANFNKKLAVSFFGFIEVTKQLIPFLFTATLVICAFASAFKMLGPPENDEFCYYDTGCPNSENGNKVSCTFPKLCDFQEQICQSDKEDFINSGGWSCQYSDSIFFAMRMFLTADWEFLGELDGFRFTIALFYAVIMGIILLNIVIAVINMAFVKVNARALDIFWETRLKFLNTANSFIHIRFSREGSSAIVHNRTTLERYWYTVEKSILRKPFTHPFSVLSDATSILSSRLRTSYSQLIFLQFQVFRGDIVPDDYPRSKMYFWICLFKLGAIMHILIIMPATFVVGFLSFGILWSKEWRNFIFEVKTRNISNELDEITTKLDSLVRHQSSMESSLRNSTMEQGGATSSKNEILTAITSNNATIEHDDIQKQKVVDFTIDDDASFKQEHFFEGLSNITSRQDEMFDEHHSRQNYNTDNDALAAKTDLSESEC